MSRDEPLDRGRAVSISLIRHHPGVVRLVVREEHRLAADREVAPLRMALVVLGHQDPAQVRVAVEDHAEHVVDLALLVVRGRPLGRHARHVRVVERHARAHGDAVDLVHVEQLVVHAEARLLGEVVDAVDRGEEAEALAAQVLERRGHGGRRDEQRGLVAEERRCRGRASASASRSSWAISSRPVASGTRVPPPVPPDTLMFVTASGSSRWSSATTSSVPRPP